MRHVTSTSGSYYDLAPTGNVYCASSVADKAQLNAQLKAFRSQQIEDDIATLVRGNKCTADGSLAALLRRLG